MSWKTEIVKCVTLEIEDKPWELCYEEVHVIS